MQAFKKNKNVGFALYDLNDVINDVIISKNRTIGNGT